MKTIAKAVFLMTLSAAAPAAGADPPPREGDPISGFRGLPRLDEVQPNGRPPGRAARAAQSRLDEIAGGLTPNLSPADQESALLRELPSVVPLLLDPEMSEVPPELRRKHQNGVAQVLNALAADAPKAASRAAYEGAYRLADHAIKRERVDRDALNNRAAAHLGLGRPGGAIDDATAAARLDPADERAYVIRALARYQQGQYAQALEDARRAASLNPGNIVAHQIAKVAARRVTTAEHMRLDPAARAVAATIAAEYAALEGDALEGERAPILASAGPELRALGPGNSGEPRPALAGESAGGIRLPVVAPAEPLRARFARSRAVLSPADPSEQTPPPRPTPWPGRGPAGLALVGTLLVAYGGRRMWTRAATRRALGRRAPTLESGFEILRPLGNGGMGVVFEGRDRALGRRVAIKRMREEIRMEPRARERFLEEARIVAALHHPNIVDIHAIYESSGELSLVLEFVDGSPLDQVLAARGRLPWPEARELARGICAALEYAHRQGVIHRDLKPSNILIGRDGAPKVADFGIARRAKDLLAGAAPFATVAGTPQYMAPEQERGEVRPESDVFALGICLYEMLTGRRPVDTSRAPASALAPGIPDFVDAAIAAALAPDPERRTRSAAAFADALGAPIAAARV